MTFSNARGALLALLAFVGVLASAQQATPTTNILTRIVMVESSYGRGSTFSLDVDGREYWITAKHILTGARHPPYGAVPSKSVSLKILDPDASQEERWLTVEFSVIDPGNDIDIVVLAPPEPLLKNPIPSLPGDSTGIVLGGDCEFLGFPYGGGWRAPFDNGRFFWMPFVKHCNVSALASNVEPRIWVLDGINNEGFSGGPVISRTGAEQKVFGVVSGYHLEPTEVVSSAAAKRPAPTPRSHLKVNLNSGFIIAYDISYAIQAIQKSPIGPTRVSR